MTSRKKLTFFTPSPLYHAIPIHSVKNCMACHVWLEKFGEAMCYQTQMPLNFFMYFSDMGQCFCPARTKSFENQKSGHVKII